VIFLATKMQGIGISRKFFVKNQKVETHYIVTRRVVSTLKALNQCNCWF